MVKFNPFKQFAFITGASVLAMIVAKMVGFSGEAEWMIACVGILFFALVNPTLSVFVYKRKLRYFLISLAFFAATMLSILISAKLLSISPLNEFVEYRIILGVTVVFFFMANALALIIKLVIELTDPAQAQ